jgi:outer membrane protein OmpA-like peptidoglycan-associated protein
MGRLIGVVLALGLVVGCAGQQQQPDGKAAPQPTSFVIFFGTDAATLDSAGQQLTEAIVAAARSQRPRRIIVTGYGDLEGTAGAPLGHQRAMTVMQALTTGGIDSGIMHEQFAIGLEAETAGIPVHKVTVTLSQSL